MDNPAFRGKLQARARVPPPLPRMPANSEMPPSSPSLYQDFLAEREEILKHKWIKSEEAGHDVGLEVALVSWALHHRETWKNERGSLPPRV